MVIKVCIGSSCHLKGSRIVVEKFQSLLSKHKLEDDVKLIGQFCMGQCQRGVNVSIDDQSLSVQKNDVESVFKTYVLEVIK